MLGGGGRMCPPTPSEGGSHRGLLLQPRARLFPFVGAALRLCWPWKWGGVGPSAIGVRRESVTPTGSGSRQALGCSSQPWTGNSEASRGAGPPRLFLRVRLLGVGLALRRPLYRPPPRLWLGVSSRRQRPGAVFTSQKPSHPISPGHFALDGGGFPADRKEHDTRAPRPAPFASTGSATRGKGGLRRGCQLTHEGQARGALQPAQLAERSRGKPPWGGGAGRRDATRVVLALGKPARLVGTAGEERSRAAGNQQARRFQAQAARALRVFLGWGFSSAAAAPRGGALRFAADPGRRSRRAWASRSERAARRAGRQAGAERVLRSLGERSASAMGPPASPRLLLFLLACLARIAAAPPSQVRRARGAEWGAAPGLGRGGRVANSGGEVGSHPHAVLPLPKRARLDVGRIRCPLALGGRGGFSAGSKVLPGRGPPGSRASLHRLQGAPRALSCPACRTAGRGGGG